MTPRFLTVEHVRRIHQDQVGRYGGDPGVRDEGMLASAVAAAQSGAGGEYFHASLAAMAGAYLFHLVRNHPFVDGNKRVGAVAARVFLMLNDMAFDPPLDAFEELVMRTATGQTEKHEVIRFIEAHLREEPQAG